jgi:hypothetical protein
MEKDSVYKTCVLEQYANICTRTSPLKPVHFPHRLHLCVPNDSHNKQSSPVGLCHGHAMCLLRGRKYICKCCLYEHQAPTLNKHIFYQIVFRLDV